MAAWCQCCLSSYRKVAIDCSMHHYVFVPLRKKKKIASRNMICNQFKNILCFDVIIHKKFITQSQYNRVDCFGQPVRWNHLGKLCGVKSEGLGDMWQKSRGWGMGNKEIELWVKSFPLWSLAVNERELEENTASNNILFISFIKDGTKTTCLNIEDWF